MSTMKGDKNALHKTLAASERLVWSVSLLCEPFLASFNHIKTTMKKAALSGGSSPASVPRLRTSVCRGSGTNRPEGAGGYLRQRFTGLGAALWACSCLGKVSQRVFALRVTTFCRRILWRANVESHVTSTGGSEPGNWRRARPNGTQPAAFSACCLPSHAPPTYCS